ncbi:hypothetical protein [Pseudothauera rhizosphaerae]|uniref:Uncharacterized protein n=1 Tax=Pseudothauera rhizosphaerae TaxID=2565932 RepID=A0A4S4AE35_9RHOO|nr:hypothetical protein [Pseudothauera rhizosphaerae]THF57280.1 hypothetical protein E6O51_18460 [Pseudothauera rhizosphaerae]
MVSSVGNSSGINFVTSVDIKNLDIESAMMLVQSQRAQLLEGQLKTQMEDVSNRNKEIAKLNDLLDKLRTQRPGGTDPEKWGNMGADKAAGREIYAAVKEAGLTMPTGDDEVNEPGTGIYDAKQKTYDTWIEGIKGKIDSLNSTQQLDMIRLQSLTNKRNEAFEIMTNFISKMSKSRESIVGNMR